MGKLLDWAIKDFNSRFSPFYEQVELSLPDEFVKPMKEAKNCFDVSEVGRLLLSDALGKEVEKESLIEEIIDTVAYYTAENAIKNTINYMASIYGINARYLEHIKDHISRGPRIEESPWTIEEMERSGMVPHAFRTKKDDEEQQGD